MPGVAGAFMKYKPQTYLGTDDRHNRRFQRIGLVTAQNGLRQRVRGWLAARQEGALQQVTNDLHSLLATANGQAGSTHERAVYVAADVRNQDNVQRIAQLAIDKFGEFDTWVNDAGCLCTS